MAKELGAVYFRPSSIFLEQWPAPCEECDLAQSAGLKLVLTVRNTGPSATTPPRDLKDYRRKLAEVLDKYRPALLVIENEENSSLFYRGTPSDYRSQLEAACEVAHQRRIACTNGGLVGTLVALLVFDHYSSTGNAEAAESFAERAFEPGLREQLRSGRAKEQIEKGKALLESYRLAKADFVNFHWYIADTGALEEAVVYLREHTGLQVLTNEVGQLNDDPMQTTAVMQTIVELRLPVAIWFGLDGPRARGIVEPDGTLRPTGEAFRRFVGHLSGSGR